MTVGENIRHYRQEKGFTQKRLGELCGINEANIRKYELGGANPKIETLKKIAIALGIDVSFLLEQGNNTTIDNFTAQYLVDNPKIDEALSKTVQKILEDNKISICSDDYGYINKQIFLTYSANDRAEIYNLLFHHICYSENDNYTEVRLHPYIRIAETNIIIDNRLHKSYEKLNQLGKEKAIEHIEMLTKIPEYRKDENE